MRAALPALLLCAGLACGAAAADYEPCGPGTTDPEMMACMDGRTRLAERRMAAALAKLRPQVDRAQRAPLAASQRAWVSYRRANCAFYEAQDGSVSRIKAAECRRVMTEARTMELEAALEP